jgi:hypothetical protein
VDVKERERERERDGEKYREKRETHRESREEMMMMNNPVANSLTVLLFMMVAPMGTLGTLEEVLCRRNDCDKDKNKLQG